MRRPARRSKAPRGLASIAELVPRVYPSKEPEELRLVRALAWWEAHLPARISKNARPAKIVRGALVIHTASSAWAQELVMLLPRHLEALAAAVPGLDPGKVRVQSGPLPPRPLGPAPVPPASPPLALHELPESVARALASIGNDAVREAVARAAAQSLAPRGARS
jgi:hypothetical protein